MNKGELVEAIAKDAKITRGQARDALGSFVKNVQKALKKGDSVSLVGFGTFKSSKRAARSGRNPQTGKPIKIPAKKVARFSPGKALKEAIQ